MDKKEQAQAIEQTIMKKDIEFIKIQLNETKISLTNQLDEVKVTLGELLKTVSNSLPAIRHDVNLANQRTVELKIELEKHLKNHDDFKTEERLRELEKMFYDHVENVKESMQPIKNMGFEIIKYLVIFAIGALISLIISHNLIP